ncbi:hypothetical protein BBJ28_00023266 [Nothophytophthora sp. Chile5]|nr:hypothetical protein BBJ28_00023266 [Nothophytophthora sp. Chile5]
MSDFGDVATMFSSRPSARILQQHRDSVGSALETRTLDGFDDEAADTNDDGESVRSAPARMPLRFQARSESSRSVATALSLEEVHQQLAELENAPAPTKAEIDELLAQYSDYSDGSSGEESVESSSTSDAETVIMKVLIVGNARCGKTSTIRRFTQDRFCEEYVSTIGADFVEKLVEYDDRLTISLQLWDIAGQDRFAKFTRGYFREAKGAVIVCDITRANTIDAVVNWKNEIDTCCKDLNAGAEIPVVMVANKSDLLVDPMGALDLGVNMQKCVAKNNIVEWFRASAKNGESIGEAFQCLIDRMVEDYRGQKEMEKERGTADSAKVAEEPAAPEIIRLTHPPQYNGNQEGYGCDCN